MQEQPREPIGLAAGVAREYLLHHRMCPRERTPDGFVVIATAPGAVREGLDELARAYQSKVVAVEVTDDELDRLIERTSTRSDRGIELARAAESDDDYDATADVRDLANQPPVIRYVNLLVRDAYDGRASDIHLEATRDGLTARFRLDGVLVPAPDPPAGLHHAVVSLLKLKAELDIAERRRPQDGRIRVRLESRELDLRVSTVPTMHGESVVLRLLDHGGRPAGLEELGMDADMLAVVTRLARKPHGMLLVTGPTGSGKTTTLYAALQSRNALAEKILTVEDPIEYQLANVTQVPVHRQIDVTFASALRAILRQDPDVIMIGEMRDHETAEIAVQAAMTGHFVFSTLHTNDAVSAVPRLVDLGVPAYLVAATLEGILAQRLVRRICDACRVPYQPAQESIVAVAGRLVGKSSFTRGAGCPNCRGTGFRGRIGLFELLVFGDEIKEATTRGATRSELRAVAQESGMRALREDGWRKVELGLTTVEEVLHVAQE